MHACPSKGPIFSKYGTVQIDRQTQSHPSISSIYDTKTARTLQK